MKCILIMACLLSGCNQASPKGWEAITLPPFDPCPLDEAEPPFCVPRETKVLDAKNFEVDDLDGLYAITCNRETVVLIGEEEAAIFPPYPYKVWFHGHSVLKLERDNLFTECEVRAVSEKYPGLYLEAF